MKYREFIYVGDPIPELDTQEYAAFYFHFQKAILASLQKRNLLTDAQWKRCVALLEKQDS